MGTNNSCNYSPVQYYTLIGDASGEIVSVAPSTAGYILTSNGASASPSFQSVSAAGAIITVTGNDAAPESPTSGNFNIVGTGSITTVGSSATETIQLTGLTNHNILIGAGTATITNVAPSSTSGIALISQGSSADPAFGTTVVAGGGTGSTTFTIYGPVVASSTTTGALTSVAPSATTGVPFISQGSSLNPAFGTAVVAGGGTGATSFTTYGPVVAASTSTGALTSVTPSATSGVPLISKGSALNPAFGTAVVAGGGTGIATTTAYAPICGGTTATGAFQAATTGLSTAGYVLTSTGASSLPSFQAVSAAGAITTITGSDSAVESPTTGNFNILGTGSITTVGSTSTETIQLTGLTSHNLLIGAGTATITKVAPSATSGVPVISQGASSDPVFGTAVVAGGGTGSTSFTAYGPVVAGVTSTAALTSVSPSATSGVPFISQGSSSNPTFGTAVVAGGGTGATSFTANGVVVSNTTSTGALSSIALTNGQLAIGSTSATPVAATLTAGTGVTITNAAGAITINAIGTGVSWTDVTGTSQAMAINNGYTANNASLVTLTLPTTAAYGSVFVVVGKGAGLWKVAQNASQQIHFGNANTTSGTGGSLASTLQYDMIWILCTVANTGFTVLNSVGNITVV